MVRSGTHPIPLRGTGSARVRRDRQPGSAARLAPPHWRLRRVSGKHAGPADVGAQVWRFAVRLDGFVVELAVWKTSPAVGY
jgi:hypothetical protein